MQLTQFTKIAEWIKWFIRETRKNMFNCTMDNAVDGGDDNDDNDEDENGWWMKSDACCRCKAI